MAPVQRPTIHSPKSALCVLGISGVADGFQEASVTAESSIFAERISAYSAR